MTTQYRAMTALATGTLMMAFAQAAMANAADTSDNGAYDEIIVTASGRAQTLQEVPISVGVVTGDAIAQQGQRLFTDLQASVPNLQIDNTNGNYAITIRGLGSGANNLAFEQSVGLFVDGVYSSRARSLQVPFLDVDRIEVVRGPQGALFGKNTNAGAISMVTRRPTRSFEAELRGSTEVAQGGANVSGFISGPITDTLSFRLAAAAGEADGYMKNELTGKYDNGSNYKSGRAQLLWEPTDNLEVLFKAEGFRNKVNGSNAVFSQIGTSAAAQVIAAAMGDYDTENRSKFTRYSRGAPEEYDVTKSKTGAMTINWTPGDWSITSITAYNEVDSERTFNTIPGPINLLHTLQAENSSQFFQEVRVSRDITSGVNLAFGATYTDADLDILQLVNYNGDLINDAVQAINPSAPMIAQAEGSRAFTQSSWSLSPFAILEAELTDALSFSGSVRYSYEKKRARAISTNDGTNLAANNEDFDISGKRTEKLWDYSMRMRYEFDRDISAYISYATGTKGGGFLSNDATLGYNMRVNGTSFDFEDERAKAWELGTKMRLFDRKLDLDIALFRTRFDNLQVSSFDGTAFITGNAAKATAKGIEVEARYRPSSIVNLGVTGAYLDAKYNDYPGGSCLHDAPVTCSAATNNLKGVRLTRAPEWKGAAYVQFDVPVSDDLIVTARGSTDYTSRSYMQGDMSPLNSQAGYAKVDARLALRKEDGAWELAVVGRNLTNKETYSQTINTPFLGKGSHVVMINAPRMVTLEAVARF